MTPPQPSARHWRSIRSLWVAATLSACQPGADGDPIPDRPPEPFLLAEVDQWTRIVRDDEDLFGADRPENAVCDEMFGVRLDNFGGQLVLEIKTEYCNYVTMGQPSQAPLYPGDVVQLRLWHQELVAPEPAEAHLGFGLDGQVAWEQMVPIPSVGGLLKGDITVDRELPAGTPLQFHVHNHGVNAYELIEVTGTPGDGS